MTPKKNYHTRSIRLILRSIKKLRQRIDALNIKSRLQRFSSNLSSTPKRQRALLRIQNTLIATKNWFTQNIPAVTVAQVGLCYIIQPKLIFRLITKEKWSSADTAGWLSLIALYTKHAIESHPSIKNPTHAKKKQSLLREMSKWVDTAIKLPLLILHGSFEACISMHGIEMQHCHSHQHSHHHSSNHLQVLITGFFSGISECVGEYSSIFSTPLIPEHWRNKSVLDTSSADEDNEHEGDDQFFCYPADDGSSTANQNATRPKLTPQSSSTHRRGESSWRTRQAQIKTKSFPRLLLRTQTAHMKNRSPSRSPGPILDLNAYYICDKSSNKESAHIDLFDPNSMHKKGLRRIVRCPENDCVHDQARENLPVPPTREHPHRINNTHPWFSKLDNFIKKYHIEAMVCAFASLAFGLFSYQVLSEHIDLLLGGITVNGQLLFLLQLTFAGAYALSHGKKIENFYTCITGHDANENSPRYGFIVAYILTSFATARGLYFEFSGHIMELIPAQKLAKALALTASGLWAYVLYQAGINGESACCSNEERTSTGIISQLEHNIESLYEKLSKRTTIPLPQLKLSTLHESIAITTCGLIAGIELCEFIAPLGLGIKTMRTFIMLSVLSAIYVDSAFLSTNTNGTGPTEQLVNALYSPKLRQSLQNFGNRMKNLARYCYQHRILAMRKALTVSSKQRMVALSAWILKSSHSDKTMPYQSQSSGFKQFTRSLLRLQA